jgi:hypothetical protein
MDDEADFSRFRTKAAGPSPNEFYGAMAEAGDFEGLFKAYHESMPVLYDVDLFFPLLQRAIDVAASEDPSRFSQRIFSGAISFMALLGLRAQMTAEKALARLDHGRGTRVEDYWLQEGPVRTVLNGLQEIQVQLANLLHAQASTARTWQLVKQRQLPSGAVKDLPAKRSNKVTRKRSVTRARRRSPAKPIRRTKFMSVNGNGKGHGNTKAP